MPRYLIGTEVLVTHLRSVTSSTLGARSLRDVAVSALTFEAIAADAETAPQLDAIARGRWRTNVVRFREQLLRNGGDVPDIGRDVIEQWGGLQVAPLHHRAGGDGDPVELSTEERLVVATALARGLIYLTHARDYVQVLQDRFELAVEVV